MVGELTIPGGIAAATVADAAAGDANALARLVGAHHDDMARICYVTCGDRDMAPASRVLVLVLVGLLLAALGGGVLVVGSRLLAPPPPGPDSLVTLPDLTRPMAYPLVAPIADARVLVIGDGGQGGDPTVTAELYDPGTGTSTPLGPIGTPRGFVDSAIPLVALPQ